MSKVIEQIKKLPSTPGVYFFMAKNKSILYIGKATALKSRVRSYFSPDVLFTRGPGIAKMIPEIVKIDFTKTDSVLEALMLEADLIRKFKPKYNVREKDDKSYNCVGITDESYPRLILVRKKDLREIEGECFALRRGKQIILDRVFGPFPEAGSLREALKIIRRIFPYRDLKCEVKFGKPCFNRQIGLCPGTCTNEITVEDYRKIVRKISLVLQGKMKAVKQELSRDMRSYAKDQKFELAAEAKRQLQALKHIEDVSLIKSDKKEYGIRMEAYDIAHLGGSGVVGVMVVSYNGHFQKAEYRMFNVSDAVGSGDVPALKDILARRLRHSEWDLPQIAVVDGGTAQLNAALEVLVQTGKPEIGLVSVVKDDRHKAREILGNSELAAVHGKEIIALNAEAHRFALSFQRRKRRIIRE